MRVISIEQISAIGFKQTVWNTDETAASVPVRIVLFASYSAVSRRNNGSRHRRLARVDDISEVPARTSELGNIACSHTHRCKVPTSFIREKEERVLPG